MKLSKTEFKQIFDKCMKTNKGWDGRQEFTCKPHMAIRDFDNDYSDMVESGIWSADNDRVFDNLEEAWTYYNSINYCRIMDASALIHHDNYCNEVQ